MQYGIYSIEMQFHKYLRILSALRSAKKHLEDTAIPATAVLQDIAGIVLEVQLADGGRSVRVALERMSREEAPVIRVNVPGSAT